MQNMDNNAVIEGEKKLLLIIHMPEDGVRMIQKLELTNNEKN